MSTRDFDAAANDLVDLGRTVRAFQAADPTFESTAANVLDLQDAAAKAQPAETEQLSSSDIFADAEPAPTTRPSRPSTTRT